MVDHHSDDALRVGTPERERAISLLNDAFSGGYLEISEFEERSGIVYSARTRGELRAVLEHLPNAELLFPDAPAYPAFVKPNPVDSVPMLELDANWETIRRRGIWDVPPRILVTGVMGTVDLDFTNANLAGPIVDVQLQVSTTTVKLRIGPDQEIRYDTVKKTGWSTVKDKAGQPSRPGGAIVSITGSISGMTSVTIKRS